MSCLKQLYIPYALSLLTNILSYLDTLPLRCLDVTCDPVEMDKAHTARQGCDAFNAMRKIRMIERIPSRFERCWAVTEWQITFDLRTPATAGTTVTTNRDLMYASFRRFLKSYV